MADGLLQVDQGPVEDRASRIEGAAGGFTGRSLSYLDWKTTIDANEKGKEQYSQANENVTGIHQTVDIDVRNIRTLGIEFEEFDRKMQELNKSK